MIHQWRLGGHPQECLPYDRTRLARRILSTDPQTVIDIGCGRGDLLKQLRGHSVECAGVDPDMTCVEACVADGLDVRFGRAEALGFPTGGFDLAILESVAHHVEFLDRALVEAARVAKRGVIVAEAWFDSGFASQRVAMELDVLEKRLDRRGGMIHDPYPVLARLAQPFLALGMRLEAETRLELVPRPIADVRSRLKRRIEELDAGDLLGELESIMDDASLLGLSHPGECILIATHT